MGTKFGFSLMQEGIGRKEEVWTTLGRLGNGQKGMGRRHCPTLAPEHFYKDTGGKVPPQYASVQILDSLTPKPLSYSLFVECILLFGNIVVAVKSCLPSLDMLTFK